MLKPYIAKVINGQDLSATEAKEAMDIIMTGQATQAQIGSYLTALRIKGETVEEITGSVRTMREQVACVPVTLDDGQPLLDLGSQKSIHLEPITSGLQNAGCEARFVQVDYEFQKGANTFLSINQ